MSTPSSTETTTGTGTGASKATKVTTLPVGALWSFEAKPGERVKVFAPDGTEMTVVAGPDGTVLVALAVAGEYVAGETSITATDEA